MTGQFHEVEPIDRSVAEEAFSSRDTKQVCDALLSTTFYDPDYRWVQNKCIEYLDSTDLEIKRLAITCLGHLARIHNKLDLDLVLPLLKDLKKDRRVMDKVEDALDDINMFITD